MRGFEEMQMTSLDVLGGTWSLRETWLWVRFRSVKDVVRFSGPLQRQEPDAVGVLAYEDAVAEVAMALRSGQLEAEGEGGYAEREAIPREAWSRAEWGRAYDLVNASGVFWRDVRIPRQQILALWPDPEPAQKVRGRPGPKDEPFPRDKLEQALEEGVRSGQFSVDHGATRIAKWLHNSGRFTQWRSLAEYVRPYLPELRRIERLMCQGDKSEP